MSRCHMAVTSGFVTAKSTRKTNKNIVIITTIIIAVTMSQHFLLILSSLCMSRKVCDSVTAKQVGITTC